MNQHKSPSANLQQHARQNANRNRSQATTVVESAPPQQVDLLQGGSSSVSQPKPAQTTQQQAGGEENEWGHLDANYDVDPSLFVAANRAATEDDLRYHLKGSQPIRFDWENKWLRGDQYAHMLYNLDAYSSVFNMQKMDQKQHPENIYIQPENGQVYFVRANSIGSDFGFPRLGFKKFYKWKKMNFTTDLPKRNPLVSYIVASAVRCEKFFPQSSKPGPVFRMHAVILKLKPGQAPGLVPNNPFNGEINTRKQLFVCCHVRRVEPNEGQDGAGVLANDDSGDSAKVVAPRKHQLGGSDKRLKQAANSNQPQSQDTIKRPRRVTNSRGNQDYDKDPYIYPAIGSKTGITLGRRSRRDPTMPQVNERKIPEQPSMAGLQSAHKPMNNILPNKTNFGSMLFSSLAADSEQATGRRRALTDVNDLNPASVDGLQNPEEQTDKLPVSSQIAAVTRVAEPTPENATDVIKKRDLKFELKRQIGGALSKDEFLGEQKLYRRTSFDAYERNQNSLNKIFGERIKFFQNQGEQQQASATKKNLISNLKAQLGGHLGQSTNPRDTFAGMRINTSRPDTDTKDDGTDGQAIRKHSSYVMSTSERQHEGVRDRQDSILTRQFGANFQQHEKQQPFLSPGLSPGLIGQSIPMGARQDLQAILTSQLGPTQMRKPILSQQVMQEKQRAASILQGNGSGVFTSAHTAEAQNYINQQQNQVMANSAKKYFAFSGLGASPMDIVQPRFRGDSFPKNRGISLCSVGDDLGNYLAPQSSNQQPPVGQGLGSSSNMMPIFSMGPRHKLSIDESGPFMKSPAEK